MPTASDKAGERLRFAIDEAEKAGDLLAWIDSVVAQYERMRSRGVSPEKLAELRRALADRASHLRAGFRSRVGRLWTSQVVDTAFGTILRDVLADPDVDPAEVFRLTEATKARTLLDAMQRLFREPPEDARVELMELERALLRFGADRNQGLVFDEMRLTSELPLGGGAPGRRPREELRAIEDAYAEREAGFVGVAAPPALHQVMAALAPNELLLEYVVPHHPLHPAFSVTVLAIQRAGAVLIPVLAPDALESGFIGRLWVDDRAPVDASPLGELTVELRAAIQRGDDNAATPHLRRLYDLLIEPLARKGLDPQRFERVTIVPHRALHPLPWAALTAADEWRLIDRAPLAFAPSAAVWLALRERAQSLTRTCLALGNPPLAYAGVDPLPAAEEEIRRLSETLVGQGVSSDGICGVRASETSLVELAPGRGLVYLATHGAFPEADALDFHRLLLARTRRHDGIVSAEDVRRLDLREAWLVVLSICDGGLYRFGPGDEPQGLIPSFLAAGAQNVIATLWQIDDSAGRDLMGRAAPHLVTRGPAEALRRATADITHDRGVPIRDWAGFVVAGTGRPPQA